MQKFHWLAAVLEDIQKFLMQSNLIKRVTILFLVIKISNYVPWLKMTLMSVKKFVTTFSNQLEFPQVASLTFGIYNVLKIYLGKSTNQHITFTVFS